MIEALVRKLEEGVEKAELLHDAEGGGVNGVTAEVAIEVSMLFEDGDVDAGAGEEEGKDDAGGASADDASGGLEGFGGWWRRVHARSIESMYRKGKVRDPARCRVG